VVGRLCASIVFALAIIHGRASALDLLAAKDAWQRLELPDRRPAEFTFDGADGVIVRTDRSVAFLYRDIGNAVPSSKRLLSWHWRVEKGFPATDLSRPGGDDRPLAVHLWFSDRDHPSLFGRLGWLFGYPHISHTVTYAFGGRRATGSVFANPFHENGAIFVLRGPGTSAGNLYTEKRNIDADIAKAFMAPPMIETLKYIAISADTDDTGADSRARVGRLILSVQGDD
jgi:hypothetical protein